MGFDHIYRDKEVKEMGMYSYITKQDLRVRKGYLHKLRQTIEKHRHGDGWRYYESVDICADGRVKLDDLNGCKIIGYWDMHIISPARMW